MMMLMMTITVTTIAIRMKVQLSRYYNLKIPIQDTCKISRIKHIYVLKEEQIVLQSESAKIEVQADRYFEGETKVKVQVSM